ncbi:MAG TPA: tetratricopeptide repeat protein [Polyangiaceae bacterium]|nr:tetratricopeptide repeat protein [Polyangiaceae bacterium]
MRASLASTLGLIFALGGCATQADIVGQAVVLADRGRYPEAEALLGRRLTAHPDDIAARRLLVRIDGLEGNLGRARTDAEALAVRLGPASPLPWVELGHALELAHRYDEALELYDRAAEVAPRDPIGPKTGGMRSARWGELDLARPRLEESLRRDARDAEVWHALGVVCLKLGDEAAAERAYRSGLVADPHALENHVGLATLAFVEERPDAALREFDAVLAERPKRTDAMLGRSLALIELRRFDEAERTLSDAERGGADRAVVTKQRRLLAVLRSKAP